MKSSKKDQRKLTELLENMLNTCLLRIKLLKKENNFCLLKLFSATRGLLKYNSFAIAVAN